jgi:hypothetical protein
MERLEFDLLFRWFVGLGLDDAVWDHSVFSKNRDPLLEGEIAAKFFAAVLAHLHVKQLLSSDHFLVVGTLVEAWASMKSLNPGTGVAVANLQRALVAIGRWTSAARNGAMTPTFRPAIRMPCSTERERACDHAGWRQGLRRGGLRDGAARDQRHAAYRPEQRPALRHRWADNSPT